jgi:hypothetical protein
MNSTGTTNQGVHPAVQQELLVWRKPSEFSLKRNTKFNWCFLQISHPAYFSVNDSDKSAKLVKGGYITKMGCTLNYPPTLQIFCINLANKNEWEVRHQSLKINVIQYCKNMIEHTGKVYFCCNTPWLVATSSVWKVTETFILPSISPGSLNRSSS